MSTIYVSVCARSGIVLAGIAACLAKQPGIEVVAAGSTLQALSYPKNDLLSVLVIGCDAQPKNFLEILHIPTAVTPQVRPQVRVVAMTQASDTDLVIRLLQAGVHGLVANDCHETDLAVAVRAAAAGDYFLQGAFAGVLAAAYSVGYSAPPADSALTRLTHRELAVLKLVAAGLSNDHIAQRLVVEPRTIRYHLSNIFRKLGVRSRREAMAIAYRSGILSPRD